jgi:hypothetical protein
MSLMITFMSSWRNKVAPSLIRGFGIVASQVMERLYEARKVNPRISVVHLSRAPKSGNRFGRAKRAVDNHWEFQPFNWPKGTWGGVLRAKLEAADPPGTARTAGSLGRHHNSESAEMAADRAARVARGLVLDCVRQGGVGGSRRQG